MNSLLLIIFTKPQLDRRKWCILFFILLLLSLVLSWWIFDIVQIFSLQWHWYSFQHWHPWLHLFILPRLLMGIKLMESCIFHFGLLPVVLNIEIMLFVVPQTQLPQLPLGILGQWSLIITLLTRIMLDSGFCPHPGRLYFISLTTHSSINLYLFNFLIHIIQ